MTDDEAPLPGWVAVDVGPIGPNFVWVVRVRSSRPADAEHPWQVVKHGLCQREMQGQLRGGEVARSITYRVERVLEELCCTGSDREFPRARDLEDGPVRVGWWRSTPDQAGKGLGMVHVGATEVFWGQELDAWELARAASVALLGKPLDLFEEES